MQISKSYSEEENAKGEGLIVHKWAVDQQGFILLLGLKLHKINSWIYEYSS